MRNRNGKLHLPMSIYHDFEVRARARVVNVQLALFTIEQQMNSSSNKEHEIKRDLLRERN